VKGRLEAWLCKVLRRGNDPEDAFLSDLAGGAAPRSIMTRTCSICGGVAFEDRPVLWPALISEWELSPDEVAYIDKQQGRTCLGCGANLRVIAWGGRLPPDGDSPA
jgi:hypothetical protein